MFYDCSPDSMFGMHLLLALALVLIRISRQDHRKVLHSKQVRAWVCVMTVLPLLHIWQPVGICRATDSRDSRTVAGC